MPAPHLSLIAHPGTPETAVERLTVTVNRVGQALFLRYELAGAMDRLRLPEASQPCRSDGLWRHSCFECFLRHGDMPGYDEYNFASSLAWAHYRFSGYRLAAPLSDDAIPAIAWQAGAGQGSLSARIFLPAPSEQGDLHLALAAVIEDQAGDLSYWALQHPAEKPDFHHPDSFVRYDST